MSHLLEPILNLPPAVAYTVIALLVFGEAAVFLGFVLPGETAVVLGGVLASRHDLSLPWLLLLVVVAAVLGDSVGYEVGKHYGERVLQWRLLHRHSGKLDGARGYLRERGGSAVFLGRWTAFFRAVMPGLAGMSRMPYRRFLVFNAVGGIVWGVTFTLVGYLAGNSYAVVEKTVGRAGALVTLTVVLVGLVVWHRRRGHRDTVATAGTGLGGPALQAATSADTDGAAQAPRD
ncbi:DedA family protein [Kineosporia sp. R_H_3]|uniref:DedA family protein n=1 Tax=Kineosporia sp. R_H_3 TaxID=1961848 RepID=UPI000B4BA0AB|nr:DedA family protein [Kineosporia sp. R_H_3]